MFGKRSFGEASNATMPAAANAPAPAPTAARVAAVTAPKPASTTPPPNSNPTPAQRMQPSADATETPEYRSEAYYRVKSTIFNALIETIDLTQLAQLDSESARDEIRDIVAEIISIKNVVMSIAEQEALLDDICNDVLGYGPLEPLLSRDDIADVMVNGANAVFIEVNGKVQKTGIRFRDNGQLMNIVPPLAIDGPTLTIRKFRKDKLRLSHLVEFGSISPAGAKILQIIGACRCNVLISGGTGSGKTTLLNTLTAFIDPAERIVTCEDAAELQLQQPHTVRLETRPPNLEGTGAVTMRDLVKNCLRMRPDRIIVGEVRGSESFDLLQAMNTGHDGSMGTLHANTPREALSRLESKITMGGFSLPPKTIREIIVAAVDVVIQAARLRDGSRRITQITEVMGLEGETIITQDLLVYDIQGEDQNGRIIGRHRATGVGRPRFWERARYFGLERELAAALDEAEHA